MLGEPIPGRARSTETRIITPQFNAFTSDMRRVFSDSAFGVLSQDQAVGSQEILALTSSEGTDLLRLATNVSDLRVKKESSQPSSGIGFFKVQPMGERLMQALRVWQIDNPGMGLSQGIELHSLVFSDPSSAEGFWIDAKRTLRKYVGERGATGQEHDVVFKRMMEDIAQKNPHQINQVDFESGRMS